MSRLSEKLAAREAAMARGPLLKPSVANVRALTSDRPGWGTFKRVLFEAGIIGTTYADAPDEWTRAYLRAYR